METLRQLFADNQLHHARNRPLILDSLTREMKILPVTSINDLDLIVRLTQLGFMDFQVDILDSDDLGLQSLVGPVGIGIAREPVPSRKLRVELSVLSDGDVTRNLERLDRYRYSRPALPDRGQKLLTYRRLVRYEDCRRCFKKKAEARRRRLKEEEKNRKVAEEQYRKRQEEQDRNRREEEEEKKRREAEDEQARREEILETKKMEEGKERHRWMFDHYTCRER